MSQLPGFVSEYDALDMIGISSMTTVSAATTKLTVTITPGTDEVIYLFGVSGFYDGASTGVALIYDGTTEIGHAAMAENTGHPYAPPKAVILDGALVILLPKGAAGSSHANIFYKSVEPPSVLWGAKE